MPPLLKLALIPLAVLGAEGAAWWWMHPKKEGPVRVLHYHLPLDQPGVAARAVEAKVIEILNCDQALSGSFDGPAGSRIDVHYFEWNKANKKALFEAFSHAPEVCMGISGYRFEGRLPERKVQVGDLELVFDVTRFRPDGTHALYIFKAPWIEGFGDGNALREGPGVLEHQRTFKFRAVKDRFAPDYARVLMVGVSGFEDEARAWEQVAEKVLPTIGVREAGGG